MRILHTADWHLRESQYGDYARGLEFFNAAERLITVASTLKRSGEIDCIINGGDILDKKRPPSVVIHQLMKLHDQLVDAGIPMFTITGNHDQDDPAWISLVKQYPDRGIIPIDDTTVNFMGKTIRGILATSKKVVQESIESLSGKLDILVWHGAIKEAMNFDDSTNLSINDFVEYSNHLDTKLILLGDIHKRQYMELPKPNGTKVLGGYPGTIELCSVSEQEDKSFTVIDFDTLGMQEHKLTTRPFINIDLSTSDELIRAGTFLAETNSPALIKLKYYLDERLELFNSLNIMLMDRQKRYKDIVRYSNESPQVENMEINLVGEVTLQSIAEAELAGSPVLDVTLELLNRNGNPVKTLETFINSRIPQFI